MTVVTRSEWGARPPRALTVLPWSQIDTLYVHYTAAATDQVGDQAARVRSIQRYHQDSNGWSDIAYSWLFSHDGDSFEGRGWGVYPAATLGQNHHSQAICFLGADKAGRDDVTDAGRKTLGRLIINAEKIAGKKLTVMGHRDAVATACPGDELEAYVKLRGWETEAALGWPSPLPKWAWRWIAWRLAEGPFAGGKPGDKATRYLTGAPRVIPPWAWARLKSLVDARVL